ncbi:MAG: oligosaccharide flippase family protein [Alphaproteobacteria bacterium]|nr:oligosaccharide flippase family protein [Alphaproteobacteria bacterium]
MLLLHTLRTIPGQVAGPLAQMAGAVAFTHWLGPAAMGVYALAWAAQELAYFGVVAGWSTYVQRHAAAHLAEGDIRRLNAAESAVQLVSGLLQALIACAAIALILDAWPSLSLVVATAAFTVTRNLGTHFAARARAETSDIAFTILQVVGPAGGLALGVFALANVSATPEALLYALAIAQGLGLIAGLPFMSFRPLRPHADRAMLRSAWVYGAPLLLSNLLEWPSIHGIRLIVEAGLGVAGVGLMTVAWWLGLRLAAFVALLVTGATFAAAIAKLDRGGAEEARAQLADNGALLLALLLPATVGVMLLARPLAELLVAPEFAATTGKLLPLAMCAGALRAFREHASEQSLLVFRRTHATIVTTMVEMPTTVILCTIGMLTGGLEAAVAGCAVAALGGALFSYAYAARLTGYYLRASDLARVAGATAVMAAAMLVLPPAATATELALTIVFGAAVYGLAATLLWRNQLRRVIGLRLAAS